MYLNRALLLCAAGALFASAGSATTMQDLVDGAALTLDGVSVTGWAVEGNASSVTIDFSAINVLLTNPAPLVWEISYTFGSEFSVTDGEYIDIWLAYSLAGAHIEAASMLLTDPLFTGAGGSIKVDSYVFVEGVLRCQVHPEIDSVYGPNLPSDQSLCPTKNDPIDVEKHIQIQAYAGGTVSLGDMHQRYIPEPATLALMAGGLLGAAGAGRRRRLQA